MEFIVKLNQQKVESLSKFFEMGLRYHNMVKDSVFVVQAGTDEEQKLFETIHNMDCKWTECIQFEKNGYTRLEKLDTYIEQEKKEQYLKIYEQWMEGGEEKAQWKKIMERLPFHFENHLWEAAYERAFYSVVEKYKKSSSSEMAVKNFMVLLLYWIELYFPKMFVKTKGISQFPTLLYMGQIKKNEYFFCLLFALCGGDVYGICQKKCDIEKIRDIAEEAQLIVKKHDITGQISEYKKRILAATPRTSNLETGKGEQQQLKAVSIQRRENKRIEQNRERIKMPQTERKEKQILSYEELAKIASSIVKIIVVDEEGNAFATGSGVIINEQGYILTNFHVIRDGAVFGIQLEEEEEVHFTNSVIKYHVDFDLALLRIEPVNRKSVPVYQGTGLVRGQKVVAIGSPLGLFNTVSDGIIAGFRDIDDVPMIQFTAPTSPGSSGGALLDLCGNLIGIVAGGFDEGQNLNIAVDYTVINSFIGGFIKKKDM